MLKADFLPKISVNLRDILMKFKGHLFSDNNVGLCVLPKPPYTNYSVSRYSSGIGQIYWSNCELRGNIFSNLL